MVTLSSYKCTPQLSLNGTNVMNFRECCPGQQLSSRGPTTSSIQSILEQSDTAESSDSTVFMHIR